MSKPTLTTADPVGDTKDDRDSISHASSENATTLHEEKEADISSEKPAQASTSTAAAEPNQRNRAVWIFLIICILSSPFLMYFDLIVVGAMQPNIVRDLGQVEKLPWISVAYALAGTGTTLFWARLYTLFDIKYCFIASFLVFEAGSAVSGAAPTMNALIGGRVLSGLGAIGLYTGALHTLTAVTDIRQRPLYMSYVSVATGVASFIGPVIGGAFAESAATWRWGFYINLCMSALFAPGYLLLFPAKSYQPPSVTFMQRLKQLDAMGNLLWAGACATMIMGISFGGALYAWNSGQIIGLLCASGVLWILFGLQQWKSVFVAEKSRIFPSQFIRSLEICLLFAQTAASSVLAQVPIFIIPLYFQFARGDSAISAGLHLLPLVGCRCLFVLVNGFCMRKYGYVMPWYVVGSAIALAGSAPFLAVKVSTPSANIYGYTALIGIGVGMYGQASFAVAQVRTAPALVPHAVLFITAGQLLGSTTGLAVANSVFINRAAILITRILPDVTGNALRDALLYGDVGTLDSQSNPDTRLEVLKAVVKALDESWAPLVAACGLSVLLSLFMKRDRAWK